MDDAFACAVEKVLKHEGGYVHHPSDPGGETNFGISKRSYPSLDIKNLTRDEAVEIYRGDWWDRYGFGAIENAAVAGFLFDLAVNMGAHTAVRLLQEALDETAGTSLEPDGVVGPATIEAVDSHSNPDHLLDRFRLKAVEYYLSLHHPEFLAGWIRRALD